MFHMKGTVTLLVMGMLATGCKPSATPETASKGNQSTTPTLVDGFTGRTAVNAGQKAKADITRISEQRNRDLESVLP